MCHLEKPSFKCLRVLSSTVFKKESTTFKPRFSGAVTYEPLNHFWTLSPCCFFFFFIVLVNQVSSGPWVILGGSHGLSSTHCGMDTSLSLPSFLQWALVLLAPLLHCFNTILSVYQNVKFCITLSKVLFYSLNDILIQHVQDLIHILPTLTGSLCLVLELHR